MSDEHTIKQAIKAVLVVEQGENSESYTVGCSGVTRIEGTIKSGMYSNIPYIRVWQGDIAVAEFCQHNIVAVYFETKAAKATASESGAA